MNQHHESVEIAEEEDLIKDEGQMSVEFAEEDILPKDTQSAEELNPRESIGSQANEDD